MADILASGLFIPDSMPNFAEKIDDKYICVSCKGLLSPPVKQTLCGHRMCAQCITKIIQAGNTTVCPGGEKECVNISDEGKVFPDFGTEREMKKLKVFCDNKEYGCENIEEWAKLKDHLQTCKFSAVPCPYQSHGCSKMLSNGTLEAHKANCRFRPILCKYCDNYVPKYLMEEEHEAKCSLMPKECKYVSLGCTFTGPKEVLDKHHNTDHGQHIGVLMKNIAELQLNETKLRKHIQDLKNENDILKHKAEAAEKETKKIKTQYDNKIKALQKMTGGNAEEIYELKKLEEPAKQVTSLQELSRNHESRITTLERRPNAGPISSMTDDVRAAIKAQEQSIQMHDIRLAEYDLRFQCLETTSYNGILLWKIHDYKRRKYEAVQGRTISLYSQPFYTHKYGYKMCARVYLNGDGMGKGSHLSLFFVIMKGDYDALLAWPFRQKVTLTLMDQEGGQRNLSDTFRPDPTSNSFKKPAADMNVASGCPLFVSQDVLESSKYLNDDTIYIKVTVDIADLVI